MVRRCVDCDAKNVIFIATATAIEIGIAITTMTSFAAICYVGFVTDFEADAADVASAICWICRCVDSGAIIKVSNRID